MSNNGSILIDGKEQIVEVIRMVRAPDGTKGIEALDDPTGMNHSAHGFAVRYRRQALR